MTIVLDAAAALGAASDGQRLGEMECAASTLSFNGNKTFTCGGGGAVLTSNEEVAGWRATCPQPRRLVTSSTMIWSALPHDQPSGGGRVWTD